MRESTIRNTYVHHSSFSQQLTKDKINSLDKKQFNVINSINSDISRYTSSQNVTLESNTASGGYSLPPISLSKNSSLQNQANSYNLTHSHSYGNSLSAAVNSTTSPSLQSILQVLQRRIWNAFPIKSNEYYTIKSGTILPNFLKKTTNKNLTYSMQFSLHVPVEILKCSSTLMHIIESSSMFMEGQTNTITLSTCNSEAFYLIFSHLTSNKLNTISEKNEFGDEHLLILNENIILVALDTCFYLELKDLAKTLRTQFALCFYDNAHQFLSQLEEAPQNLKDYLYEKLDLPSLIQVELTCHRLKLTKAWSTPYHWTKFLCKIEYSEYSSFNRYLESVNIKNVVVRKFISETIGKGVNEATPLSKRIFKELVEDKGHFEISGIECLNMKYEWLAFFSEIPKVSQWFKTIYLDVDCESISAVVPILAKWPSTMRLPLVLEFWIHEPYMSNLSLSSQYCQLLCECLIGMGNSTKDSRTNSDQKTSSKSQIQSKSNHIKPVLSSLTGFLKFQIIFIYGGLELRELHKWVELLKNSPNAPSTLSNSSDLSLRNLYFNGSLSGNTLTQLFDAEMINTMKSVTLEKISISHHYNIVNVCKNIAKWISHPGCQLAQFHLKNCSVSTTGLMTLIPALNVNDSITDLYIGGENMSICVPDFLKMLKTRKLNLHSLSLTDAKLSTMDAARILTYLSSNKPNHEMKLVDISRNQIDEANLDAFLSALSSLRTQTFIMTTILSNYALSDLALSQVISSFQPKNKINSHSNSLPSIPKTTLNASSSSFSTTKRPTTAHASHSKPYIPIKNIILDGHGFATLSAQSLFSLIQHPKIYLTLFSNQRNCLQSKDVKPLIKSLVRICQPIVNSNSSFSATSFDAFKKSANNAKPCLVMDLSDNLMNGKESVRYNDLAADTLQSMIILFHST